LRLFVRRHVADKSSKVTLVFQKSWYESAFVAMSSPYMCYSARAKIIRGTLKQFVLSEKRIIAVRFQTLKVIF
jgi:hypothetical protein